jgi:hypothetical protein
MFDDEQDILREMRIHLNEFDCSQTHTQDEYDKWIKDAEDIEYKLFWCRLAKLGLADGFRIFQSRLGKAIEEVNKINEVNKYV